MRGRSCNFSVKVVTKCTMRAQNMMLTNGSFATDFQGPLREPRSAAKLYSLRHTCHRGRKIFITTRSSEIWDIYGRWGMWLIRCFHCLEGFDWGRGGGLPRTPLTFWLPLRQDGQIEDIRYLYNDGIPFGPDCAHTQTRTCTRAHRPHVLAKGHSLQTSWVIFHFPGSKEFSLS